MTRLGVAWVACWLGSLGALAAPGTGESPADAALRRYFAGETSRLEERARAGLERLARGGDERERLRQELLDMLGLWPMPERTPLQAVVAGKVEGDGFVVERLQFQSMPGLYVTGNLYRPAGAVGRLPGVLYVCGHAAVRTNGVSCGNKTAYQHHGMWFARHGYVCLTIDTLQLGEIEGDHHGTHRLGQWWWNSRGYTPAGVETWNGIRALDYLESRADVDAGRIGMTGRSGGGSYTWTTAAIDERVRVAAPVAGITDLRNHVVDGVVEGHCDCMYFVNTHQWDFAMKAALVAPRPLLIVNTDADTIFPLDGVQRVHAQVRRVYEALGAVDRLGLVIAPGPHRDTQDLQVPVFRWFNRHLKGEEPLIGEAAVRRLDPMALRVFGDLPEDQRNTTAQEWFGSAEGRGGIVGEGVARLRSLRERVFGGWPDEGSTGRMEKVEDRKVGSRRLRTWTFESQSDVPLRLDLVTAEDRPPGTLVLRVLDPRAAGVWAVRQLGDGWGRGEFEGEDATAWAFLAPRGIGEGGWSGDERKQVQIRRRFMLLGQTLDGMRIWDIRRGLAVLREVAPELARVELAAEGAMGVNALYAALFEPGVAGLDLQEWPASMREGPDYLNVGQVLDYPAAIEWARARGVAVRIGGR
ncbi:MAG: acetylxylan esterase [Verrucomicrobiae bacterium]|nr:acetylxylan esterase [Verrucomicrobiae bacterium]